MNMKLPKYTPPTMLLKQAKPILIIRAPESVGGASALKKNITEGLNNEYHVIVLSDSYVKKSTFELVK